MANGVIWLPTTSPVASSTNWAKARVGRVPGGLVPREVRRSTGAPTTTADRLAKLTLTVTALAARAGVMGATRVPITWEAGGGLVSGPELPVATSGSVPWPSAVIGPVCGSGQAGAA